jgi:hypothetical protein
MRCITVDVNDGEVAALVARGYLPEEARGDPAAIKVAIEVVISDLAFELVQERSKEERISLLRCSEERVTERRKN